MYARKNTTEKRDDYEVDYKNKLDWFYFMTTTIHTLYYTTILHSLIMFIKDDTIRPKEKNQLVVK